MRRLDVGFALVVLASVVVGGATAANFGSRLHAVNATQFVEDEITTQITDVHVENRRLYVEEEIRNPTKYDIRLTGSFLRAFNETDSRIAWGSVTRVDDESNVVPSRESLTVRFVLRLTPQQADRLRSAPENGGFSVTGTHSLELRDTRFTKTIAASRVNETTEVN